MAAARSLYSCLQTRGGPCSTSGALHAAAKAHAWAVTFMLPHGVPTRQLHAAASAIPAFPGLDVPSQDQLSEAIAWSTAGMLSDAATAAAAAAQRQGNAPARVGDLASRLHALAGLESQFPGFDLEQQLLTDASTVMRWGSKLNISRLRSHMRLFQDLAPSHLPPVGSLMQQIGAFIAASPRRTAITLHTLDTLCHLYLSMPFPTQQLSPRCTFLTLPDHALAESIYALYMVLGREHARTALQADVHLLGLPPAQIEAVPALLRRELNVPLQAVAAVQQLVASAPSVMHMKPSWVQHRLEQLEQLCTATPERTARLRSQRNYAKRQQLALEVQQEAQQEVLQLLQLHPRLLLRQDANMMRAAEAALNDLRQQQIAAQAVEEEEVSKQDGGSVEEADRTSPGNRVEASDLEEASAASAAASTVDKPATA